MYSGPLSTRMASGFPLQLTVDAVDAFVVPLEAFDIAQIQVAQAKAPHLLSLCQRQQMIRDLLVLIAKFGPIPIAGLADAEGSAGQSGADLSVPDGPLGHLFALRRPHHFFPSASFNKSACMLISKPLSLSVRYVFILGWLIGLRRRVVGWGLWVDL